MLKLRRADVWVLVGGLSGIGLCIAVGLLLRGVDDWPGVWVAVRRPGFLYALTGAALVAQLVGVALVIQDLHRYHRHLGMLMHILRTIEAAHNNIDKEEMAREAAQGNEWFAQMIRPVTDVSLRVGRLELMMQGLAAYHREFRDPRPWVTWSGPVLLFAGIVFGGAAALLGI
ncbi:hypothetical protein [Mycolicibacterium brisbanense]